MQIDAIITEIQENIDRLSPSQLSEHCVYLSTIMFNLSDKLVIAEIEYAKYWTTVRKSTETDGQADKRARDSRQYEERRQLELKLKAIKEVINALKVRLRLMADEIRNLNAGQK